MIFAKKASSLMEDNYIKLLKEIKNDLGKWGKLGLSLLGRIMTIKMNVLSKLLFLFQAILIILKKIYIYRVK